jgi:hypothetical protein
MEVMSLDHAQRRRWVDEVASQIEPDGVAWTDG